MSSRKANELQRPTVAQMEAELRRVRYRKQYADTLRSTVYMLVLVAAIVLLAVVWLPVLRVSGDSMDHTLSAGDIVVARRTTDVHEGDLMIFSTVGRKTLIKRVIGMPGDVIEITEDGVVSVNGQTLNEYYVKDMALGECDIEFPFKVPGGRYFVMGDHRDVSLDSRNTAIGCVAPEQIIGCVAARIWPLEEIRKF